MASPASSVPGSSGPNSASGSKLGLALPRSQPKPKKTQPATPTPLFGAVPSQQREKKRKRKQAISGGNLDRALDEGDDVDESDLVLVRKGRHGHSGRSGGDGDGDGDGEEEDGPMGSGSGKSQRSGRYGADREGDEGEEGEEGEGEGDGEDDVEDADEVDHGHGDQSAGRAIVAKRSAVEADEDVKKRDKKAKGERLALRSLLDPDQAKRFDAFSVAVIPKQVVKKLNKEIYDQRINDKLGLMLAGMAKIFVADIVELAKELQPHTPHPTGALRSYHLRMARGMMEERGILPTHNTAGGGGKKPLFRR